MGERADKILTETFRDKRYEDDFTKLFFSVIDDIGDARMTPTIEHTRKAYASVSKFCLGMLFSKEHLERFERLVMPTLKEIGLILYGDRRLPSVRALMRLYSVNVMRINGKDELESGQELVNQLDSAVFLVKQWALEEGMFLPKPIDRKYGIDAIASVLEQ